MPDIGHWLDVADDYLLTWVPILLVVIIYLLWRTLQYAACRRRRSTRTRPARSRGRTSPESTRRRRSCRRSSTSSATRSAWLGAKVPKGILLYGPPGTGKTLLAKAVANESGDPTRRARPPSSRCSPAWAQHGFASLRGGAEHAPAIIFIDEPDAVGTSEWAAACTASTTRRSTSCSSSWTVGERDQVIMMGASNRLQDLDPALLRPGRFDRQVNVSPPDLSGRELDPPRPHPEQAARRGRRPQPRSRQTAGLTGADLANICNEAAIFAGRQKLQYLRETDFEAAMERVVAGLQQRRVVSEKEKRILAFHEAGHALMDTREADAARAEGDDRRPRRRSATPTTCPWRSATCTRRRSSST